ncbi:hypothetical protein CLOM_g13136 [Closterium sp. NIES-68]|nr:hypothetical protein CLOM_g21561 [Closterium sp. NIES-68]GJP54027.1 hypothetical protein CLOM_g13136 [Closterium sp. NIES-68]GJP70531.1 hypothetical protein CLOP_g1464 [Closterium sp. NIES-67]
MACGKLVVSLLFLLAALLAFSNLPSAQGARAPFATLPAPATVTRRVLRSDDKTCSDKYEKKMERCEEKEQRCLDRARDWWHEQKCTDKRGDCEWDASDAYNDCQAECTEKCDEKLDECYNQHHSRGCDRKDQKCRDKCN